MGIRGVGNHVWCESNWTLGCTRYCLAAHIFFHLWYQRVAMLEKFLLFRKLKAGSMKRIFWMLGWGINLPGALSTPNNEAEMSFSNITGNPLRFKEQNFFQLCAFPFDKTSGAFGCNLMFQVNERAGHYLKEASL